MRPEKAHMIVRNVMKKFYRHHESLPKDHKLLDRDFIKAVDVCLRIGQKDQVRLAEEYPDIEICVTTKAYYEIKDTKDILSNLMYISDRWNCVGRLLYLKDVIEYIKNYN